jgi:DNA-binding CsgD family transcriptional regulator
MLFFFRHELERIRAEVREARPAHVVAMSGTGVTTLFDELAVSLESEGCLVLRCTAHPFARDTELFALHEAGFVPASSRGPLSPDLLVTAIASELAAAERRVMILDSIEFLDPASLRILAAAAQRTRTPVVFSRTRSFLSAKLGGLDYTLDAGTRVHLRPLGYADTARLIQDRLEGPAGHELVSLVYASSAGITGLSLAFVDGARAEGLIRVVDGRWSMTVSQLWSPTVEGWIESLLATLASEEVEALQHLAITHRSSSDRCERVPTAVLRSLEGRGMLGIEAEEGEFRYRLHPPALAVYFPLTSNALSMVEEEGVSERRLPARPPGRVARAVRASREKAERQVIASQTQWEADRTVAHAIDYLQSLPDSLADERTVRQIFAQTPLESAVDAAEAFDFEFLRLTSEPTRWGIAEFDGFLSLYPDWRDSVELFFRILQPVQQLAPVQLDEASPAFIGRMPGGDLLLAAHAYALLVSGDFAGAVARFGRLPSSRMHTVHRFEQFLSSLATFADGDIEGAIDSSGEAIEEALEVLDHGALLLHSYVRVISMLGLGRWHEARDCVEQAVAFGQPRAGDAGFYRAMLYCGAFLAISEGDPALAEFYLDETDGLRPPSVALPGMQGEISEILRQLMQGRPAEAIETLRALARRLLEEGAVFAALLNLRIGLAMWPERATVDAYGEALARTSHVRADDFLELLRASFEPTDRVVELSRRYTADPDDNVTMAAIVLGARVQQEQSASGRATDALRAASDILEGSLEAPLAVDLFDGANPNVLRRAVPVLSDREREIARLAGNQTNAQIASRLSLSVRTVESHLYNAFKKTGAASRQELFELAAAYTSI